MAKAGEVRGVSAHRERPVIVPKPYNPARQWMTHDEAVRQNKAEKAAKIKAKEAYENELAKAGVAPVTQAAPKADPAQEKIESLRKALANAEKKLQEKPDSKAWAKKVKDISEELEVAEASSID